MHRAKFLFSLMVFLSGALLVVGRSQSPPVLAPVIDRIGFPYGYQYNYTLFYTFDQFQNRQIRVAYGNDVAAGVKPGQPYPYATRIWRF